MKASSVSDVVRQIIELLVARNYGEIATITNNERLSSDDIASAIADYGRQLMLPPHDAYEELLDAVEVAQASAPTWSVRMPLWTTDEGRSDLTLELTVTQHADEYAVEVDDIHVL